MLKYRNFGKKSLNEIKDKLVEMGLGLGMTFDDEVMEEINAGIAAASEETGASGSPVLSFDDDEL